MNKVYVAIDLKSFYEVIIMTDNYNDIKHLTRPQYDDLHPMSMHDRATQFSPFAALIGYDDVVAETARHIEKHRKPYEFNFDDLDEKYHKKLVKQQDLCYNKRRNK